VLFLDIEALWNMTSLLGNAVEGVLNLVRGFVLWFMNLPE
jgi:hypothetical protein